MPDHTAPVTTNERTAARSPSAESAQLSGSQQLGAPPLAIHATGIGHAFGEKVALAPGLALTVPAGSGVVGLLGPNGSGKSTLMRLLVGLVPKTQGDVTVDGVALTGDGLNVRKRVTYAPGEMHLYGELRGDEHLRFLLRGRTKDAVARATAAARELGLPLDKRVREYSHGMKRQLVFSAAMAPAVNVRILDEISEGLDPAKRAMILALIEADARNGTTILLSSHHLGEIDRVCERLVFLNAGRIVADESAQQVKERAQRLVTMRFASETDAQLETLLHGDGVDAVTAGPDGEFRITLLTPDPRPFLARIAAAPDIPAPTEVQFGRHSLSELYTALYGVEGV